MSPLIIRDKGAERDRLFYNLLPGERAIMRAAQNNLDPITQEPLSDFAHLDHDHTNGLVRGLLNPMTNKFIVSSFFTFERVCRLMLYLEEPPGPRALGGPVYGLVGKAKKKKKMLYGPDGSPDPQPRGPGALAMPVPSVEYTEARAA